MPGGSGSLTTATRMRYPCASARNCPAPRAARMAGTVRVETSAERRPIGIKPNVAINRQPGRHDSHPACPGIARERHRRPTEIKGVAGLGNDAFDDVRIDHVADVMNGMAKRGHGSAAIGIQHRRDSINGRCRNLRLIPCTLTTMTSSPRPSAVTTSLRRSVPVAWSLRVIATSRRQHGTPQRCGHHRWQQSPALPRTAPHAPPPARSSVCRTDQSTVCRETGGCVSGRNDGNKRHISSCVRAVASKWRHAGSGRQRLNFFSGEACAPPPSSMTGMSPRIG